MSIRTIMPLGVLGSVLVLLAIPPGIAAQVVTPPPPAEYRVEINYRIYAAPRDRIPQFDALVRRVESVGFKKDAGEEGEAEDPSETRMTGVIPSADAHNLLGDPHVKSILLIPSDFQLPQEPDALVHVSLELASGLGRQGQAALEAQVRERLLALAFREDVGYDNRGHTRMAGWVPVNRLRDLLTDLRSQPGGWLAPDLPYDQTPPPLRNVAPITVIEVQPQKEPPSPPAEEAPPPKDQEYLLKVSPELRRLAAEEGGGLPRRLEIILSTVPAPEDPNWRRRLQGAAPGLVIEGMLGAVATVTASPKDAPRLAALDTVSSVRLPRPAFTRPLPAVTPLDATAALSAIGLQRLQRLGKRGRGVTVAVIDEDFHGYEQFVGNRLPARTRLIDLTAEYNLDLEGDRLPQEGIMGRGTQCALALALAAPEAELTLLRVNASCPYQLHEVARFVDGEAVRSESLVQRREQLDVEEHDLAERRNQLLTERKEILANFSQEPEPQARRAAYEKRQAQFEADQRAHDERFRRLATLERDLASLKNTSIVSSSLVWPDGYAVGAQSALSRYFDSRCVDGAVWLQAAGDTRDQTWSGLFRDEDESGAMEFAPPGASPLPDRWTNELNFLGWQAVRGRRALELSKGLRMHLSVQWREAHDREFFQRGPDLYRQPLARLRLVVLRQIDPEGKRVASDELEVVARSQGLPQRLDVQPESATYEQTLDFTIPATGRYALRLEGVVPPGTRPLSLPTLPALQRKHWELYPRVFVDTAQDRARGRPVFVDYATDLGNPGLPADARGVTTVGAADAKGQRAAYSSGGPPLGMDLVMKPDVMLYGDLRLRPGDDGDAAGTAVATALAAGCSAVGKSAGMTWRQLIEAAQARPDKVLRIP